MIREPLLLLCAAALALGQDVSRLPDWAREPAALALKEAPPAGAEAWVVLDRQEVVYQGGGEIRTRHFRLAKILAQKGLDEAELFLGSGGGQRRKVKSIRGWNLRPDGELVKLGRDDMAILDADGYRQTTTTTYKGAALARVVLGSLVAFEFEEIEKPFTGPVTWAWPLGGNPVRRWEVLWSSAKGGVEVQGLARRFKEWGVAAEPLPAGGFALSNLPAWPRKEAAAPSFGACAPFVEIRFADREAKDVPSLASWDTLASWYFRVFQPAVLPSGRPGAAGLQPVAALRRILEWMNRELVYHMVYLTSERSWVPLTGPEVVRRRSGDCKDHVAVLLGEGSAAGLEGFPALCSIGPDQVEPAALPSAAFNHAIAAFRLKASLGLPAEVETPAGRFLLVDSTDRFCPFGKLPDDHRGRSVLICTPQGGQWVAVPDAATEAPTLRVDLEGALDGAGDTRARIRLRETGNAWDLRLLALEHGAAPIKENLLRDRFDLPATGQITDLTLGDPLDLERPFEVSFTVTRAGGVSNQNGKVRIGRWGLPASPGAIQRAGTPRRLPVDLRWRAVLDYHAAWTFPEATTPALPELDARTPLADLRLRAATQGAKATLDVELSHKDARFGWERREEGVAAWRAYRSLLERLEDEGLLFRTGPR